MDFAPTPRAQRYIDAVGAFVRDEITPREREYQDAVRGPAAGAPSHGGRGGENDAAGTAGWSVPPLLDELKGKARAAGLWNLFLPTAGYGAPGLSNSEYAPLAEIMGGSFLAPQVFNCNAPDTGNAEVLLHYGSDEQKERWLAPLLDGRIRSAFCMTEPGVASSDASNMQATAVVDGDEVVLDGRKWWSTGVGHPDARFAIFMGLTDPDAHRYARHSMVLVPLDAEGVKVERMLPVFGYHDEPYGHGEVTFTDVRLPKTSIIGGPGRGFEIAQGRLGPGRVHHCMRLIGLAELCLGLAIERSTSRVAFGKPIANLGGNRERIAHARIAINQARLLVQHTAWLLDTQGIAGALSHVSQIKAAVPRMAQDVVDMAIQLHGGAGLSDDFPLAGALATARALRLADGPDEVHLGVVARLELAPYLQKARPDRT